MKLKVFCFIIVYILSFNSSSSLAININNTIHDQIYKVNSNTELPIEDIQNFMTSKYNNQIPYLWGENVPGVITRIYTQDKIIALTFDACGGGKGIGYDKDLIEFLKKEQVPATLFINARWIDANLNTFMELSKTPIFEIENHGYNHKPLSVNGKSIYGIKGTENVSEVVEEILLNERKIQSLTGRKPKYFRSGTAYYDEVAVKISKELGEMPINYNILGDAGATFTREQVKKACLSSTPGSIVLLHMNHPDSGTAEGIMDAVPELRARGYKFVKLEDYQYNLSLDKLPVDYFYYSVVSGDSLWKISTRFEVPIQEINIYNQLNTTTLYVGQKLKLPVNNLLKLQKPVEIMHTVVSGDTLWKLSRYYGAKLEDIRQKNNLDEGSTIYAGKLLIIPLY